MDMTHVTIERLRALIGPAAAALSDSEMERVRECLEWWAAAIFEHWLASKRRALMGDDSPDVGGAR